MLAVKWTCEDGISMVSALQIRRLCDSLVEESPEGEELDDFLAEPSHVLARIARDVSYPDEAIKNFERPMQVHTHSAQQPHARTFHCDGKICSIDLVCPAQTIMMQRSMACKKA